MPTSRQHVIEEVLEVFERVREAPGSPFERERLVDYLAANLSGAQDVESTYKGRHLFNRFINSLELHMAVCFSLKDLETLRSLDGFADRISHLQNNPGGSLGVITHRLKEPFPLNLAIVVTALCCLPVALCIKFAKAWGLLSLLLPGGVLFLIWRLYEQDRRHCREVRSRIMEKKQSYVRGESAESGGPS